MPPRPGCAGDLVLPPAMPPKSNLHPKELRVRKPLVLVRQSDFRIVFFFGSSVITAEH